MSRYADRIVTLVDGIITEMKGKDSEDGDNRKAQTGSGSDDFSRYDNRNVRKCFGRGDRQFRGAETIAQKGLMRETKAEWLERGLEGMGAGAAGANGAGDSTTESAGTETGVAGHPSRP